MQTFHHSNEFRWRDLDQVVSPSEPHVHRRCTSNAKDLTLRRAIAQLVFLDDLASPGHCSEGSVQSLPDDLSSSLDVSTAFDVEPIHEWAGERTVPLDDVSEGFRDVRSEDASRGSAKSEASEYPVNGPTIEDDTSASAALSSRSSLATTVSARTAGSPPASGAAGLGSSR